MRLLFIADGRSPITRSWLRYWTEHGHETHLVSTFPCDPPPGLASFHVLPVAFNRMAGAQATNTADAHPRAGLVGRFRSLLRPLRYLLGPLSLPRYKTQFRRLVADLAPDLVHALRIPFEGMLATAIPREIPLVVSIWGNDITLHARGFFLMAMLTRRTLRRADGLMADASRDIRLGQEWGFHGPTLVVPGSGGIRFDEIRAAGSMSGKLPEELPDAPLVVNPRGHRPGSLRQDVFFQSIPLVLEKFPKAIFVCPPFAGDAQAKGWVSALNIESNVRLWPLLSQPQLWALYKKAQVYVSPSVHDGTPNSLLEAMTCGCFPVTGNIESMQEWISPGVNGLLVDATDPRVLADAVIAALENEDLRHKAAGHNAELIAARADYGRCMANAEQFYLEITKKV
jgi:hypothetical protein